jgi:hypothetical protein
MKSTKPTADRPKAQDVMVAMASLALEHRGGTPRLRDIVLVVSQASRCLRVKSQEERLSIENAAVMEIGRKLAVIS